MPESREKSARGEALALPKTQWPQVERFPESLNAGFRG